MNKIMQSKEELQEALCDVRNSFRLLKEYQQRMLDIVSYIKERYSMPEFSGKKHFCDKIRNKRSGYADLQVWKDMWAWDFLYAYEFEYYLGQNSVKLDDVNLRYAMSVLQVSDSGFYESTESQKHRNRIETFKESVESSSALIFIFERIKGNADWLWDSGASILDEVGVSLIKNKGASMVVNKGNNCFIAARYPLEEFFDQASCDTVLREFDNLVHKESDVQLLK
ncbi:MAG: hypothetical protein ACEPOZ_19940 [Marinifilaceae bacterium]